MEFTPLQVFSPCCHKYQAISSKFSVFNFLLCFETCSDKKHSSISKNQIKTLATNKETILDLQTCKIIDSVVEKTMMTSWLCYQLSFNNQIWRRDSFQEGIGVCQIHCPASAVTLFSKDGEGEIHSSSDIESQKIKLTLVEL